MDSPEFFRYRLVVFLSLAYTAIAFSGILIPVFSITSDWPVKRVLLAIGGIFLAYFIVFLVEHKSKMPFQPMPRGQRNTLILLVAVFVTIYGIMSVLPVGSIVLEVLRYPLVFLAWPAALGSLLYLLQGWGDNAPSLTASLIVLAAFALTPLWQYALAVNTVRIQDRISDR